MINGKHGPKFRISDDLKSDVIIDVFVGDKKESCDAHVEHSSVLEECIPVLGRFVKLTNVQSTSQNAFNLLMATSKKFDCLPSEYSCEERKDNDIVK